MYNNQVHTHNYLLFILYSHTQCVWNRELNAGSIRNVCIIQLDRLYLNVRNRNKKNNKGLWIDPVHGWIMLLSIYSYHVSPVLGSEGQMNYC